MKELKSNLWTKLKKVASSKIIPSIMLIIMWLMSSVGYYRYINVYFKLSFEEWQQILEVRENIIYLIVRFHVAVLLFVVLMSGFAGVISWIVAKQSKNESGLRFIIFNTVTAFVIIIFAIGIQLYFEDTHMLLQYINS